MFAIAGVPDNVTAAALALSISSTGAVSVTTTVLLTAEEIDAATKKQVDYRPPGSETDPGSECQAEGAKAAAGEGSRRPAQGRWARALAQERCDPPAAL